MKIRVLVLTEESLSALSVYDNRLRSGYCLNQNLATPHDFFKSPVFNSLLSLSDMLKKHVLFTLEDIYNVRYQSKANMLDNESACDELNDGLSSDKACSCTNISWSEADFAANCQFFTLTSYTPFDISYIKEHFDAIFFFLHSELGEQTSFDESLLTLLSSQDCPELFIFNLKMKQKVMDKMIADLNYLKIRHLQQDNVGNFSIDFNDPLIADLIKGTTLHYIWQRVLPKASFISVVGATSLESRQKVHSSLQECEYVSASDCKMLISSYGLDDSADNNGATDAAEPFIIDSFNGYLNFRRSEAVRSLFANTSLISSFLAKAQPIEACGARPCVVYPELEKVAKSLGADYCEECASLLALDSEFILAPLMAKLEEKESGLDSVAADGDLAGDNAANAQLPQAPSFPSLKLNELRTIEGALINGGQGEQSVDSKSSSQVGNEQQCNARLGHQFTIGLSSTLFVKHPVFGVSPYAARLVRVIKDAFPKARLVFLFNDNLYSYLRDVPNDALLSSKQEQALNLERLGVEGFISNDELTDESLYAALVACKERGSQEGLSSVLLNKLNSAVAQLIKVELFLEQKDLPSDESRLNGSYWDSQQDKLLKKYEHCFSGCALNLDYEDFKLHNFDLLISDRSYEQMMAVSHGIASLGLENDLDFAHQVDESYFVSFDAARVDFMDFFAAQAQSVYPLLIEKGLLKYGYQVSKYHQAATHDLGLGTIVPQSRLSVLLSEGVGSVFKRIEPYWNQNHLGCRLQAYYEGLEGFDKSFKAAFYERFKEHPLLPLESIAPHEEQQEHLKDKACLHSSQGQRVAQKSNYTSSHRYLLPWLFLSYFAQGIRPKDSLAQDFKLLSFGCSRGLEVCDMVGFFKGATIKGIDINQDAILSAQQMVENLKVKSDSSELSGVVDNLKSVCASEGYCAPHAQEIEVLGNRAFVNFESSYDFFKRQEQLLKDGKSLEQFDVVSAMTVLCRHPDTVGLRSSSHVYPFLEFEALLSKVDSLVKKGGLLCILNANYRLEDTKLGSKYVRLFPFSPSSIIKEDDNASFNEDSALKLMEQLKNANHQDGGELAALRAFAQAELAQAGLSDEELAAAQLALLEAGQGDEIVLPALLSRIYQESSSDDKYGYVTLFDNKEQVVQHKDLGVIFWKIDD